MCPSLVEIRSVTSEIRSQKKKEKNSSKILALQHRNAVRANQHMDLNPHNTNVIITSRIR